MDFNQQDETYFKHRVPFLTGIDATEYFSGIIVVTEHGHDSMPVTLYSRLAWRCDDALFKIAYPNNWIGYINCMDEADEKKAFAELCEHFESLGLRPAVELRLKGQR